ncbi:hypothetical protein BH11BAC3_BH11BAC3_20640 [soil metagenome]
MPETDYVRSHAYESYIKLARLCQREQFGAHNQHMLNLIYKDKGQGSLVFLKHNKVLSDVKKYMTSATKFAIKRKIINTDKEQVKTFLLRIEDAQTSDQLLTICKEGIEIFRIYKPAS